jgi:hypothetical protein
MGVVFVLLVMKPFLHFRKEFLKVLLPKLSKIDWFSLFLMFKANNAEFCGLGGLFSLV